MTEYIKREDAINAVKMLYGGFGAMANINAIPSADVVERKKGKWIKLYAGNYKCSVCGDWWGNDDNEMVEDFKYCPNCGTDMRGEENG